MISCSGLHYWTSAALQITIGPQGSYFSPERPCMYLKVHHQVIYILLLDLKVHNQLSQSLLLDLNTHSQSIYSLNKNWTSMPIISQAQDSP